jgi:hypothetical protein
MHLNQNCRNPSHGSLQAHPQRWPIAVLSLPQAASLCPTFWTGRLNHESSVWAMMGKRFAGNQRSFSPAGRELLFGPAEDTQKESFRFTQGGRERFEIVEAAPPGGVHDPDQSPYSTGIVKPWSNSRHRSVVIAGKNLPMPQARKMGQ